MYNRSGWQIGDSFTDKVQPITQDRGVTVSDIVNTVVNKDQIIADRQAEQVGSIMSDVKLGEIRPDLQTMALNILENSKNDIYGLYRGQNNVLKLSNQNKFEAQRIKQKAMMDFSALNQLTADHKSASLHMAQLAKDGVLSQQDIQEIYSEFDNSVKGAGNPGDVKFLSALVNQKAGPKIAQKKQEDAKKEVEEWDKQVLKPFQGEGYTIPTVEQMKEVIKSVYPGESLNNYADKYRAIGAIGAGDDPLDVIAKSIHAKAFPKEKPGSYYFNLGGREKAEPVIIPFANGVMPLSAFNRQVPWVGTVTVGGKEYPASGSTTDIIEKPDGSLTQRVKAVYYVGNTANDIVTEKPFTGDVTGKLKKIGIDTSELEGKKGAGKSGYKFEPYKKFYKFKSSDPIDVDRLKDGEVYILDGEKVKWNGAEFDYAK